VSSAIGNCRGSVTPVNASGNGRVLRIAIAAWLLAVMQASAAEKPAVRLEMTTGESVTGGLLAITADQVRVEVDAQARDWPVTAIRRMLRTDAPAGDLAGDPQGVVVTLVDGGTITGDDFSWADDRATVTRGPAGIELPIGRVQSVAWRQQEDAPDWRSALPEKPESDLVVVARTAEEGDAFEFVECAITKVGPDTVTVVLDGETIPVKRGKVIGLAWVREPRAAGGTRVGIVGGELSAASVAWSETGLVLDDAIRVPAADVRLVDYAAGRTVRLADVAPETTAVEPFFGGLANVEGVSGFFAPRFLTARADGDAAAVGALVVRPRTTATWRIPADSQRFVATVAPAGGRQAAGSTQVTISVDGKPVWERRVDAAEQAAVGEPIRLDVPDGRRLTITVDFVAGTMGCAVRFLEPAFEK